MSRFVKCFLVAVLLITPALSWAQCGGACPASSDGNDACASCQSGDASAEPADQKVVASQSQVQEEVAAGQNEGTVNTTALFALLKTKTPLILLDARSGKFDDGKRIPGAKSLNDQSKPEEIEKVVLAKDALIVTYCAGLKCPASHKLAEHLKKLGYTHVIEYSEGIEGWTKAGNEVETAKQ